MLLSLAAREVFVGFLFFLGLFGWWCFCLDVGSCCVRPVFGGICDCVVSDWPGCSLGFFRGHRAVGSTVKIAWSARLPREDDRSSTDLA
jgi:hypothetical protein